MYNLTYVSSTTIFNNFSFNNHKFVNYLVKSTYDVDKIDSKNDGTCFYVSSLERTIIDCINKIGLAGGIEELYYLLLLIDDLRENKVAK